MSNAELQQAASQFNSNSIIIVVFFFPKTLSF